MFVVTAASLAILLACRALLPNLGREIGPTSGDPLFTITILEWVGDRFKDGLAGLWSTPFFFPTPETLVLSDHMLFPALVYLGLRELGGSPALAHNLLFLASFPATAWAVWLLLSRATRASSGIVAALALAVTFAPWRWGQLVHLLVLWAPGPPLALLTFDRLLARPSGRRAAAFVGAEAVTLLSGGYLALLTQLALLFVLACRALRWRERARWLRRWPSLASAALLSLAIAAPVYRPYVEARSTTDQRRSDREIRAFDARPRDWLVPSTMSVYSSLLPLETRRAERELFPGILLSLGAVLALALAVHRRGIPARRRDSRVPLPFLGRALLIGGLFFAALSSSSVFTLFARIVPGFDGMRVPTRGHLFVLLGLAAAAAIPLKRAVRFATVRRQRAAAAIGIGALLALDLVARPVARSEFFELERADTVPDHVGWLATSSVSAIAIFPMTGSSAEGPEMWRAQFHGKPIANGYSSFLPPAFRWLRSECRTPRNRLLPRCIDALQELGVTHAVIDDSWYAHPGAAVPNRIEAAIGEEAMDRVHLSYAGRKALVFELR